MKELNLVTNPTEEEKEKYGALYKEDVIKRLWAGNRDSENISTSFAVGSRIIRNRIFFVSEFMTCRERLSQFVNSCVTAPKIIDRQYNYMTCSYETNIKNRLYVVNSQIRQRSNLILFSRFLYPSVKGIRDLINQKKQIIEIRANAALRVLNDLEEKAGWRKTELFCLRIENTELFKKNNYFGVCFSGPSNWFDSPYSVSIFALICRIIRHRLKNFEKIVDFETYVETYRKQFPDIGRIWDLAADAKFV